MQSSEVSAICSAMPCGPRTSIASEAKPKLDLGRGFCPRTPLGFFEMALSATFDEFKTPFRPCAAGIRIVQTRGNKLFRMRDRLGTQVARQNTAWITMIQTPPLGPPAEYLQFVFVVIVNVAAVASCGGRVSERA